MGLAVRQSSAGGLLRLLRLGHVSKGMFVLAPLLFSGEFHRRESVTEALLATGVFVLASCAVYVFNDLRDLEADRQHAVKRRSRPLAAGDVSPRAAWTLLAVLALAMAAALSPVPQVAAIVMAYLGLNALYTWRLKRVAVVDLFCIAAGFVLRVFAGAVAIGVPLSAWMLTTTLTLALFLAAIKRRDELVGNPGSRAVLESYTPALLERYAQVAASIATVSYSLFALAVRPRLVATIPLVLFGLFRYWLVVERSGEGETPTEVVFRDLPLVLTVVAWVVFCATNL